MCDTGHCEGSQRGSAHHTAGCERGGGQRMGHELGDCGCGQHPQGGCCCSQGGIRALEEEPSAPLQA